MTNIEKLCLNLAVYNPNKCTNNLWNDIAAGFSSPYELCDIVFELTEDMPSPRKEYLQIMRMSRCGKAVPKVFREKFYILYEAVANSAGLTETELLTVKGAALSAYVSAYRYDEAEAVSESMDVSCVLPLNTSLALADFYVKTRRYALADDVLNKAVREYGENDELTKLINDRAGRGNGKKEYMPSPKDARESYKAFMEKLGINIGLPVKRSLVPVPIPAEEYPAVTVITKPDFDSYVSFDVETTGLSPALDSLTEIGAIKVIGGRITESEKFIFSELIKPYKKRIPENVELITGITNDEVRSKRQMWEVTADFLRFVGDDVLLGFNCANFDMKFIIRAARYAGIIIKNPVFDVMNYAAALGIPPDGKRKSSLADLCEYYGIENPSAHRAYADAITTARVYECLRAEK